MPCVEEVAAVARRHPQEQFKRLLQHWRHWLQELRSPIVILDPDHAARLEHAPRLAQGLPRLPQVLQQVVGEDGVKRGRRERQIVDVRQLEANVVDAALGGQVLRMVKLSLREIDTNRLTRRDNFGQVDGDGAGPAATVKQPHPRPQVGYEEGGFVDCSPSGVETLELFIVPVRVCFGPLDLLFVVDFLAHPSPSKISVRRCRPSPPRYHVTASCCSTTGTRTGRAMPTLAALWLTTASLKWNQTV